MNQQFHDALEKLGRRIACRPVLVSMNDAAFVTGLSTRSLYKLAAEGVVNLIKVDRRTLLSMADLDDLPQRLREREARIAEDQQEPDRAA